MKQRHVRLTAKSLLSEFLVFVGVVLLFVGSPGREPVSKAESINRDSPSIKAKRVRGPF